MNIKTIISSSLVVFSAFGALAQGTVNFSMRVSGTVVAHVYDYDPANPFVNKFGNTASETPGGTQTYGNVLVQGSGYTAALWAANGAGAALESLVLVPGSYTSMRTGATLGGTPAPLALAVPNVPVGGTGTFQIRVWDNLGGTITSWESAIFSSRTAASALFTVSNLGDGVLTLPADMANVRSFSFNLIPEPGTYALLALGSLAFAFFRRTAK